MFNFAFRCRAYTGRDPSELPVGTPDDVLNGHIVAYDPETNTFVVFVGWPDVDWGNNETWPPDAARIVTLS